MIQDLRHSFRVLLEKPAFTIIAILVIGLGVGANAAIFSVVDGVLLRPLPYPDAQQLVYVRSDLLGESGHPGIAPAELEDIRQQSKLIEHIGFVVTPAASLTAVGQMEHVTAVSASEDFLPALGIQPFPGRNLRGSDDGSPHIKSLLISYELWDRRYHLNPNVIGMPIEVNNYSATIVGVLPKGFRLYMGADTNVPPVVDVWFPAGSDGSTSRKYHYYQVVARIRKGVSVEQAQSEIDAIVSRVVQQHPLDYPNGDFRIHLVPLLQDVVKPVRNVILVLLGAVAFVLLIACANVANLLLARASARKKEIAIRSALGAARFRVVRQLLTESVVLALASSGVGLVLAQYGVDFLLYLRPSSLPRQDDIVLNWTVTGFVLAISLVSGILFGLAPALHAARSDVNSVLKEAGRSASADVRGKKTRVALVAGQVVLSFVLLIGAGLLIQAFRNMRRENLGFDPANLLTFRLEARPSEFPDSLSRWHFYQRATEAVRSQFSVESVSGTGSLPLDRYEPPALFSLLESPERLQDAVFSPVLPDYFKTMRQPLIEGRDFTDADNEEGTAIAIVDEDFARRTWPGESAVGKQLILRQLERTDKQLAEIVGVVRHVQWHGFHGEDKPQIYLPYRNEDTNVVMIIRARGNASAIAEPIRTVVEGLGGKRPIWDVRLMSDYVADAMAETRFALVLLGILSSVAFVLSVVGVYGVVAYSMTERMEEFAIRMALGAQGKDIFKLAFASGVAPALFGIVVGMIASLGLTRFLSRLLFGINATDPGTYLAISALVFAAAAAACYLPVRRCLRADPRAWL
jgi:putative ABC transport system permease protein